MIRPEGARASDGASGPRAPVDAPTRGPSSGPRGAVDALPYVTGATIAALTVLIAVALARNERNQLRQSLEFEARSHAAAVEARLGLRLDALERMAARWRLRSGTPREEWEADASLYVSHDPALTALAWVGPELTLSWIVPLEPNAGALGLDFRAGERARETARRALAADTAIIAEPLDLGRWDRELVALAPVRMDGLPGGFILGVYRMGELFGEPTPDLLDAKHTVAVSMGDRELFVQAPVGERETPFVSDQPIDVAGAGLRIRVWPTGSRLDDALTSLPLIVLAFGLLSSFLLTLAMRAGALHRARTSEVRLANRALAHQIDERRRAMKELAETRDTLESILDGASEGILAVDEGGEIVTWNRAAERLLGEPAGTRLREATEPWGIFHADGVTPLEYEEFPIVRAADGEPVDDVVMRVRPREDAEGIWIAVSARQLRDPDGTSRGAVAVFRDVTERRRSVAALEEAHVELGRRAVELAHANEELRRSNEELEQFAYVASHDLQEPLRTVTSFTELLAERYRGKLGQEADEFIAFIVGGALRMQRQIRDLLAYSRLQTRGGPFEPVDLDDVLDSALHRLSERIEESRAVIERRPLPRVLGDATQLRLALENLVDNAIKFSREAEPHPIVRIGGGWDREEAVIWVADNGIGIDPRYAARIFQVFQRLDPRETYDGTGIGLAICKRVVERHAGRIWVESKPGEGARFVFTLPVAGVAGEQGTTGGGAAARAPEGAGVGS